MITNIGMKKNFRAFALISLLAVMLTGCEDRPRQLAGGTMGAVGGGLAGMGVARMMGASTGVAGAIGLASAMGGGLLGAKIGYDFDQEAKAKIQQAARTGTPVVSVDKEGDEWVYTPSRKRKPDGSTALKVRAENMTTRKTVIVNM